MSKVDEELSRRFGRAEREVRSDDLFEGLARRRRRRRIVQRLEAGALAVAVLAATGGGFAALQRAFDPDRPDAPAVALAGNGDIVFSREAEDGHLHLYASEPDGSALRQLTGGDTDDSDPAVSPDGRAVAFVRTFGKTGQRIAIVPITGGPVSYLSADSVSARDPAWSPDGSRIAYVTPGIDSMLLLTQGVDGETEPRHLIDFFGGLADPAWTPDGSSVVVAENEYGGGWDLGSVVDIHDAAIEPIVASERDEEAPAWSPDGTRMAFIRTGDEGDEVWTVAADGSDETLVATAVEATLERDLAWSPDGSSMLVSDGEWIYRVDATPEGDVRDNFVQLVQGVSPSWQPIPANAEPSVTTSPAPSVSPSPEPEGVDVALAFTLCESTRLAGIDFLGNGTNGYAWVGVPSKDDGTCPKYHGAGAYVVAADADGDGEAETHTELPWKCYVDCVPYDATDLDGNGTEELIVASSFSIMDYYVMRYLAPRDEPSPVIAPILVAEPGHSPARLEGGKPFRIDAGGDEGYGSSIECEGYPDAPILVWSWSDSVVESNEPREVHITRIQLQSDGAFHVIGTNDYSVPADQPSGLEYPTAPACGVDWHPSA